MEAMAYYRTPIGILHAQFRDDALCRLVLAEEASAGICAGTAASDALGEALRRYFAGDAHAFDSTVICPEGTPFQMTVWNALRKIPFGQVRTYGEIASVIGQPGAARAVGGACNQNRLLLIVPCHRVVASGGGLGGFANGVDIKRQLLQLECANNQQ